MLKNSIFAFATLVLSVTVNLHAEQEKSTALSNPFYVMDTNLSRWKNRTPDQVAGFLKELGYDGYGHSGTKDIDKYLAALKKHDLKLFNTYLALNLDAQVKIKPAVLDVVKKFKDTGAMIWLCVPGKKYDRKTRNGDDIAVAAIQELADYAHKYNVKIALYPHAWLYVETVSDAVRIAEKVNRRNVGVTINLCHWLKVEGLKNSKETIDMIREAMPYLFQVTINGAESGDTKSMSFRRLIQPLDSGSYDVNALIAPLLQAGYRGPIGLQGYGIPGNPKENLKRSISAWKKMQSKYAQP